MQTMRIGGIVGIALVAALATVELATAEQAPQRKSAPPSTSPQPKAAQPKGSTPSKLTGDPAADAAIKEMEQQFGFVPQFIQGMSEEMVVVFWTGMKQFQMNPNTKLDGKTKELIGLAVAAQIPCMYCVEFHTQAARANGASDDEVKEAIGMAAMTRLGSTLLNGAQIDNAQFRRDVDRIMQKARQTSQNVPPPKNIQEAKNVPQGQTTRP